MKRVPAILLSLLLVSASAGLGQLPNLEVKHFGADEGFSRNFVNSILQDGAGFLWIGTTTGLYRYDGYNFRGFSSDPGDSTAISSNIIEELYLDGDNRMWVATLIGLNSLDLATEEFTHYISGTPDNRPVRKTHIKSVMAHGSGGETSLLLGMHSGGVSAFRLADKQFTTLGDLPCASALGQYPASVLLTDKQNTVWIGTLDGGLFAYNPDDGNCFQYRHAPNDPTTIAGNNILSLFEDGSGAVWVGTHASGLSRLSPEGREQGRFTTFTFSSDDAQFGKVNTISSITTFSGDDLWLGTFGGGLHIFNPETGDYNTLTEPLYDKALGSVAWVTSLLFDYSGNLWMGTNAGLYRIRFQRKKIRHYTHVAGDSTTLSNNNIHGLIEDHAGVVWVGTSDGLNAIDPKTEKARTYRHNPDDPGSLAFDFVQSVLEDSRKRVWVGTFGRGISRLDAERESFEHFKHDPEDPTTLSQNFVSRFFEDSKGRIWVGTLGGFNRFDPETGGFVRYLSDASRSDAISSNAVDAIYEDPDGILWLGTYGGGLNRFDPSGTSFEPFKPEPGNPNSLSDSNVESIHADAEGILWLGTNNGLNRFDPKTRQFTHYFVEDGLPHNTIYGVLGDERGNLWISTQNGLSCFNERLPKGRQFVNYFAPQDGLQDSEFNLGSFFKSSSGELFFGGVNGFNRFFPHEFRASSKIPKIALTSFSKYNTPVKLDSAMRSKNLLQLSHTDRFFSIEFAALDFTAPELNQYAYKLEGFHEDWINARDSREATFTNLDPGEYLFRVKGANSAGAWNEEGAKIAIRISPPYWRTWWFQLLAGAGLCLLGYAVYRNRVRKLIEIERIRVRIASDLHDDIGSTLTKISQYSDLIQFGEDEHERRKHLRYISSKSRDLVTTLSDIVWSIDARNDTVGKLVDRMREFSALTCAAKDIEGTFRENGLDHKKRLPSTIRQNIYLVFKEALNNISKHADATKMQIVLDNANGRFSMLIKDNGAISNGKNGNHGQGLKNMRLRAQRIGGNVDVSTDQGFSIRLERKAL